VSQINPQKTILIQRVILRAWTQDVSPVKSDRLQEHQFASRLLSTRRAVLCRAMSVFWGIYDTHDLTEAGSTPGLIYILVITL
jgi:hypothetical protein